uniref:Peptidase_M13_N domain-containing protein n=1 Tax=Globodera pallida TaxID=36090 RepID=A0A183CC11_GLOPA
MKKHFPKDLLPILLLIAMIAYSVSVAVIEDGTSEEEDLATALAQSKRFFWHTMMEEWDCDKGVTTINGVTDQIELRQICESWKVKALAADAYLKSWENPRFLVKQGELQLSSAMEAIKAAYRVLFGLREAAGFDTEFDFEKGSDFLNEPMLSPKGNLNQLNFEEKKGKWQKS